MTSWKPPEGVLGKLVRESLARVPLAEQSQADLLGRAARGRTPPSFIAALRGRTDVAVIAEIKRRSPSRGAINEAIVPVAQARKFVDGGAAAISVLTETDHFGGVLGDLSDVAAAVTVPLLRKDFNLHPVHLLEARAFGASAALLIARAMPPADLRMMAGVAGELGLEVLVEVRTEDELAIAVEITSAAIGVNNRDLETLEVDLSVTARLIPQIPGDRVAVYESGVSSRGDVLVAAEVGADAVLVGSSLSSSADPGSAVRGLTGVSRETRARS